jgi:hypothetical protein
MHELTPSHRVILIWVGIMAMALVGGGCSSGRDERGEVRGHVTLDGKPLVLGAITLEPIEGGAGEVTGGLVRDGRYELVGSAAARVGAYRVAVIASPIPTGRMIQDKTKPPGTLTPELIGGIVAKRFNVATTLSIEISPGANDADYAVLSR